jgi:hypothetical protein
MNSSTGSLTGLSGRNLRAGCLRSLRKFLTASCFLLIFACSCGLILAFGHLRT